MIALCVNYIRSSTNERHMDCFLVVEGQKNKINSFFHFCKMTPEPSMTICSDCEGSMVEGVIALSLSNKSGLEQTSQKHQKDTDFSTTL